MVYKKKKINYSEKKNESFLILFILLQMVEWLACYEISF